jgi:hypothetical protein
VTRLRLIASIISSTAFGMAGLILSGEIHFRTTAIQRCAATLCLLLAVFASAAAIVHFHPHAEGGPTETHCLICVAAHAPTILVSIAAPLPAVAGVRATVSLPASDLHSRFLSQDLFIRPPPATV